VYLADHARAPFRKTSYPYSPFRFFVKMEDGRKVSFWDLYRYVYHNPELKALVESRNSDVPLASGSVGGPKFPLPG